jgi:lysophospholipase L1-like esterase
LTAIARRVKVGAMIAKLAVLAALGALVVATTQGCEPQEEEEQAVFLGRHETWDYAPAMKHVAERFRGTEGLVLHVGDSITSAAPYTAWARQGRGKTAEDEAILRWSHCGAENELDGWYLASREVGDFWSYTAASGIRADQYIAGGYAGMAALDEIVRKYNPQVAIVMLGTNDAWQGRSINAYAADMAKILHRLLDNGTVPILSTIPQMVPAWQLGEQYNTEIWRLAENHQLPVIDFYGEIEARQPEGAWNGTLLNKDDPHPTAERVGVTPESEPTPSNLRESGYLLRGWLSVKKLSEVKQRVWGE